MAYKTKVPYRFTSMLLFFLDYIFLTVIPLMQVASAIPPFFLDLRALSAIIGIIFCCISFIGWWVLM